MARKSHSKVIANSIVCGRKVLSSTFRRFLDLKLSRLKAELKTNLYNSFNEPTVITIFLHLRRGNYSSVCAVSLLAGTARQKTSRTASRRSGRNGWTIRRSGGKFKSSSNRRINRRRCRREKPRGSSRRTACQILEFGNR